MAELENNINRLAKERREEAIRNDLQSNNNVLKDPNNSYVLSFNTINDLGSINPARTHLSLQNPSPNLEHPGPSQKEEPNPFLVDYDFEFAENPQTSNSKNIHSLEVDIDSSLSIILDEVGQHFNDDINSEMDCSDFRKTSSRILPQSLSWS